jgi:hypothetical protein
MKNRSETIRKIVSYLNNPDHDGGFWLPNIQRPFVWNEDQIARLFDSIMRQYPISTLLVWKTTSRIRHRRFIDNYKKTLRLSAFYVPENDTAKRLVLDGQQRLQSLFVGLMGSYEGHELHMDILSGDLVAPEDIRYRFAFRQVDGDPRWVLFKDLVFSNERDNRLTRNLVEKFPDGLTEDQEGRIEDNVCQISKVFKQDEVVVFQELDSIDNPELYGEDDVVEVFIRANAGGTKLGKSDLLFSLLSSSWDESDEQMETLLDAVNRTGYEFTRDFVLKTCLTLLKTGARYNVDKLRNPDNRKAIVDNWPKITEAIRDVKDFLYGKTYVRSDKALPSYLSLIPLIYFRYHYPKKWAAAQARDEYVLRTLLAGTFSGNPDELIDGCTERIDKIGEWNTKEIFGVARQFNRSLEVTRDTIFSQGYGSKLIHLLFNLWYRDFNYVPAFENNQPQVDHIFPQSLLRKVKRENPETGRMNMLKYYAQDRNQLANCMLLSAAENGGGGKTDTPPAEWFADKDEAYLDMHLIPRDPALWELDAFEDFVAARAELIAQKFEYLIVKGD